MVVSMLMLVSGWVVSSGKCLTNCMLFMFGMSSAAPPDSMVSMFMCVSAHTHTHLSSLPYVAPGQRLSRTAQISQLLMAAAVLSALLSFTSVF